jgi:hypothetical protein
MATTKGILRKSIVVRRCCSAIAANNVHGPRVNKVCELILILAVSDIVRIDQFWEAGLPDDVELLLE